MRARITVRAAARELEWSEQKIWRIETGQVAMRSLDVRAMCEAYRAPTDLTEALMALARETKARGWWQAYGDTLPDWFDLYVGLEEAASDLDWYEDKLVPGLFQTARYIAEIVRIHLPHLSEEEIERRVRLRTDRQAILTRPVATPRLRVALSETILRWPIGSSALMVEQLAHLVYVSEYPNVELRVVPFAAGSCPGVITGPFTILRFPEEGGRGIATEPPTVYVEGLTGGLYLDKPAEVEQYHVKFQGIWDAALDDQASRRLIAEAARSYEQH
jgi:hypothetical protein